MDRCNFNLIVVGPGNWDPIDDNIDVEVRFDDGRIYTATFFTIKNLETLFLKNEVTGECGSGLYLWAAEMIIVKRLSLDVLNATVEHLLRENEFDSTFTRVFSDRIK